MRRHPCWFDLNPKAPLHVAELQSWLSIQARRVAAGWPSATCTLLRSSAGLSG